MAEQANGWFYKQAIKNEKRSNEAKTAKFDEVVMVEITIPGDKNFRFVDKASDEHKERFPTAWAQFEASEAQVGDGTPLEEWAMMTVGRVKELKSMHIHTVEQLAELPDAFIAKLGMGGQTLVDQAKVRLASTDIDAEQLAQQVVDLKAENEALKETLGGATSDAEATAKIAELTEVLEKQKGSNEALVKQIDEQRGQLETVTEQRDVLQSELERSVAVVTERDELKAKVKELEAFIEDATAPEVDDKPTSAAEAQSDAAKATEQPLKPEDEKAEKKRLKALIKEQSGEAVKGNPSLATLRKMASSE